MPNCDAPLIGPIAIIDVSNMTVTVSTSAIGPDALSPSGTLPPAPATPVIQINTNGGLKPEWIDPERLVRLAGQDGWYTALIDIGPDKQPLTDERGKPQLSAITIDGALLCLAIDSPLSIAAGQTIQVLVGVLRLRRRRTTSSRKDLHLRRRTDYDYPCRRHPHVTVPRDGIFHFLAS